MVNQADLQVDIVRTWSIGLMVNSGIALRSGKWIVRTEHELLTTFSLPVIYHDLRTMIHHRLARFLSHFIPINAHTAEGKFGPLVVRWENGRKVLNSAHGNQSFGSLHRVWQQTLREVFKIQRPKTVLMLGYGAGSAAFILRNEMNSEAAITAIELDPCMIDLAADHFGAEAIEHFTMINGDAVVQIHAMKERFDLVLVDLFEDLDLARGVDTSGFVHGLRDRCEDGGVVCFNTVAYDGISDGRSQKIADHLGRIFNQVEEFRYEGVNRVFVAR